jgi:hypothetical protein
MPRSFRFPPTPRPILAARSDSARLYPVVVPLSSLQDPACLKASASSP